MAWVGVQMPRANEKFRGVWNSGRNAEKIRKMCLPYLMTSILAKSIL